MIRETQQEFHCNDARPGCDARDDDSGLHFLKHLLVHSLEESSSSIGPWLSPSSWAPTSSCPSPTTTNT